MPLPTDNVDWYRYGDWVIDYFDISLGNVVIVVDYLGREPQPNLLHFPSRMPAGGSGMYLQHWLNLHRYIFEAAAK
jgi:hypothetical protein